MTHAITTPFRKSEAHLARLDGTQKLCDRRLTAPEYRATIHQAQEVTCPKCLAITATAEFMTYLGKETK